jgi:hypothetical protein
VTPSIFVSYRRSDAPAHAGRLYDRLVDRFGAARVFKDLETLAPGADFAAVIERTLDRCDALVAVIGRGWAPGRLADDEDWVRFEIARALARDIRVVPVLVADAALPAAADLPDDLRGLAARHAVSLTDAAWNAQVAELLEALAQPRQGTPEVDWSVGVREVVQIGAGHVLNGGLRDVTFSSDGGRLAIASGNGSASVWELPSGRLFVELEQRDLRQVRAVAFATDHRLVTAKAHTQLWELPSGRRIHEFGHAACLAVSPDGAWLATAAETSRPCGRWPLGARSPGSSTSRRSGPSRSAATSRASPRGATIGPPASGRCRAGARSRALTTTTRSWPWR